MVRPRDSQKSRMYKAEREALDKLSKRIETVGGITKYVDRIRKRATISRRYGNELLKPVFIGDGRGKRNAGGDRFGIYMPKWSRTEYIVLHELSHCIACRRYDRNAIAAHGREFAAIYLDLVRFMLGKEAADALKAAFAKHRVKWKAKRSTAPKLAIDRAEAGDRPRRSWRRFSIGPLRRTDRKPGVAIPPVFPFAGREMPRYRSVQNSD